ncbi:hypothetical protein ABAC402_12440 [Asticcacaulis sp. AC402]|nr:hypothetical protein ABAC402_12440 [Asticcacaulis sp. AC402]
MAALAMAVVLGIGKAVLNIWHFVEMMAVKARSMPAAS